MAEHPNATLFRRSVRAFKVGDMETVAKTFADDIVWHVSGRSPLAGRYRGREAVFELFNKFLELTGGTFKPDLRDVVASDQYEALLSHATAQRGGKTLDADEAVVAKLRDGRIVEVWQVPVDQYAWDKFWSEAAKAPAMETPTVE